MRLARLVLAVVALSLIYGQTALAECKGSSVPGRLGCEATDLFNGAAKKVDDINAGIAAQQAADALAHERSREAARILEQSITKRNDEMARAAQEAVARRKQQGLAPASAINRIELNKDLAKREQATQIGEDIAGGTASKPFRDADRAAQTYGGSAEEWVKRSSSNKLAPDGTKSETHWIQNLSTGQREEFKTKSIIDTRPSR